MNVLSWQLFSNSCRDAVNWPEYVSLSFNFSPTQLGDKNFAQNVLTILADAGLPPDRLEAEITESAIVSDFETTVTSFGPCAVQEFELLLTILAPDIQVSPSYMN